ncbi:MAG TPA: tetratricopeptide repeat protein, partial [Polyangiaceae bacterium]|nr:tetratricopeptide repeat protein [Polyangiaceae bacterium]
AYEASEYPAAEQGFRAELARSGSPAARLGLARVLVKTGRYDAALELLRAVAPGGSDDAVAAACLRAEAQRSAGKLTDAEATLRAVTSEPGARAARLMLGEVLIELGRRADAREPLMTLVEDYNSDRITEHDAEGLALVGRAAHLLRSPRDSNEAFAQAEEAGGASSQLLLWRAELFLEKHEPGRAEEVVRDALERAPNDPDALVWMAEVRLAQALDFVEAERLADAALAQNPRQARAYYVLAGVALRDVELELARRRIASGLVARPDDLDLLSLRAAVGFVAADDAAFQADKRLVLTKNPERSRFFAIVGEFADWEHRYEAIVELMREAVQLDPKDPVARASLGVNLIRAGHDAEGQAELSQAFALDPFDPRVKNTLTLFEKIIPTQYESVGGARFTIRYHKKDRALLERYVPPLLDRAFATFVEHYGFKPKTPIGVELYAEREHFAVRTSGLPETAIQGVCFGQTLAAMSPQKESFNLGMTLWHELSHVFHIQLSKSRVPRWFTEGLAEYETQLARPEWTREEDPELFELRRGGRLPSVEGMNRAFTRAEQLSDVGTAYYASSRLVALLGEKHGMKALAGMLRLWGEGKSTPDVFQGALGITPAEEDRRFGASLDAMLARYQAQFVPISRTGSLELASEVARREPKNAARQAARALTLFRAGETEVAESALEQARAIDATDPDVRFLGARFALADGKPDRAVSELRALIGEKHDGYAVEMLLSDAAAAVHDEATRFAAVQAAAGFDPTQVAPLYGLLREADQRSNADEALALLERIAALSEHDAGLYRELLRRLVERGNFADAVKYGEAAIYVDVTSFETHYQFARALAETGAKKRAVFELESALLCEAEPERLAAAKSELAKLKR